MRWFKQLWVRSMRVAREELEDTQDDIVHSSPLFRYSLYGACTYLFVAIVLGIYWSFTPAPIDVKAAIQQELLADNLPLKTPPPTGVATTSALIKIVETLWNKPGGYLANDMLPPGLWLDDMPHWEVGVLLQVRDMTQLLRASLSQSNELQQIDMDLQKAEVRFNFSSHSWVFPATESQYLAGVEHLKKYNFRLIQTENMKAASLPNNQWDAHFYADSQHLSDCLAGVERRLKNLSQRLTASVGPSVNTDVAAMAVEQQNTTAMANGLYKKTPWLQIDDVFYEARGSSWALIALLQAIELDFSDVLQNKNARASFDQIIRELQPTQQTIYSPVILNGEGFGFVANHSLIMASYLARAQAAIADCRRQLLVSAL